MGIPGKRSKCIQLGFIVDSNQWTGEYVATSGLVTKDLASEDKTIKILFEIHQASWSILYEVIVIAKE